MADTSSDKDTTMTSPMATPKLESEGSLQSRSNDGIDKDDQGLSLQPSWRRELELKIELITLERTQALEEKKLTLKKQLEVEEAEEEIRRAQEKASRIIRRQQMLEMERELEQERAKIKIKTELEFITNPNSKIDLAFDSHDVHPVHAPERKTELAPVQPAQQEATVRDMPNQMKPGIEEEILPRLQTHNGYQRELNGWHGNQEDSEPYIERVVKELGKMTANISLPTPDLTPFTGDPLQYLTFKRNFKYAVEEKTADPVRRLELLLKYTKGEAHELIKECPHITPPEMAYAIATQMLEEDYGHTVSITNAYLARAKGWEPLKSGDPQGLRMFSIFLGNCCHVKRSKELSQMDSVEYMKTLAGKLPIPLQEKWVNQVGLIRERGNRDIILEDLYSFVARLAKNQNDPRVEGLGYRRQSSQRERKNPTERITTKAFGVQAAQETPKENGKSCAMCGTKGSHITEYCSKFKILPVKERAEICKKKGLCFRCLGGGHIKRKCKSQIKCKDCGLQHNTLLHDPDVAKKALVDKKEPEQGNQSVPATSTALHNEDAFAAMTIVPVLVKRKDSDKKVATYAFVDNGCGAVFGDPMLSKMLMCQTKRTKLVVRTLNSSNTLNTDVVHNLQIAGIGENEEFIDLPAVYLKDKIPVTLDDAPSQEEIDAWKYLRDTATLEFPEIKGVDCLPMVTLMIGMNVPAITTPIQVKRGELGQPYAIQTPIGWLTYGIQKTRSADKVQSFFCQHEVQEGVQFIEANQDLEEKFKAFCNFEFSERLSDPRRGPSLADERFLNIMDNSVVKESGHYQMELPFKDRNREVPNNYTQALGYANHLKKRLLKSEELHSQYTEFMNKLESKKYAERVPETDINDSKNGVWYIPHHCVTHPRKPGKVRVVFNCPVNFKGYNLNEQLLQGPDLNNMLLGVLLRWRKNEVAVIADIESMFYQVRVDPKDCDMLRYLWWPEGDLTKEPVHYRMLVHVFGAKSSPSCATYALKKTASDNQNIASPEVIDAINRDFYVDDLLSSTSTVTEAVKLLKETKEVLATGGFNLTKMMSNEREVLSLIDSEDRAPQLKDINPKEDILPSERALGVKWNAETDTLEFQMKEMIRRATRRNILSVMSSVFDPFGFAAPYVLRAKVILQQLCRDKLGWDEQIPEQQRRLWDKWLNELECLDKVKIQRCLKPKNFGQVQDTQLHHFADASKDGYGVVTYIRQENEEGRVHTAFVLAKARVAPLKPHTIVKMELSAATLAVRQNSLIERELKMNIDRVVYWTDSQTVIKYINNEDARHPVFETNRLTVIRDGSKAEQWKYVPTAQNPADYASRGMRAEQVVSNENWQTGPSFLLEDEHKWPGSNCSVDEEVNVQYGRVGEERKEDENAVDKLIHHYSNWTKLKRAVAVWLKLKEKLLERAKSKEKNVEQDPTLTMADVEKAEKTIISYVQRQNFQEELTNCRKDVDQSKRPTRRQSHLDKLNPEMRDGLLTVGGRLRNAPIADVAKHQMILPKNHHVSKLLIQHIHRKVGHQGRNHILSELRQKYWVVGAGAMTKQAVQHCIICRKNRAKIGEQMMADLPTYRVQGDQPPFTNVGMDFFGPFLVKCGRSSKKRYGVIFTCMASRAVHIEVASSMDTSSCIDAIRRFISRRGPVKQIVSDNGTNLVGACSEMRKALKELDETELMNFHTNHDIAWSFNTPAASHQGGVWERQIRTIRKILQALLNEQHMKSSPDDEQLRTLMCEVEAIINGRPLTLSSDDPHDLGVITPNDLLLMKQNGPPPGKFNPKDVYARRRWRQVQYIVDVFWRRWVREYLPALQCRQRWLQPQRNLREDDIVLIADNTSPRGSWQMGRVLEVFPDQKGLVRRVKLKTATSTLTRPITKLCLLLEQDS